MVNILEMFLLQFSVAWYKGKGNNHHPWNRMRYDQGYLFKSVLVMMLSKINPKLRKDKTRKDRMNNFFEGEEITREVDSSWSRRRRENHYVYSFTLSCKNEQQFLEINQSVTISHYLWTFNADEIVAWKQTWVHASTDTKTNSDWWYFFMKWPDCILCYF